MHIEHTFLAEHVSSFLLSPYKPLLMFAPFIFWGWLVSTKLERDARFLHLNHRLWNGVHIGACVAALGSMLFIPIFWAGWPIGMVILGGPIYAYWQYRNKQVPEAKQFHLSSQAISTRLEARRQAKASREAMIQFIDSESSERAVPLKEDPLFTIHMLAEDIIGPALDGRASMVEMAVSQTGCNVSQMIDGVKYKQEAVPTESALQVVDYLKDMAGLDVEDRRRQQTGKFHMMGPGGRTELVVTTAGSSAGIVLRLEFNRSQRLSKPFDSLGLLPAQMESLGFLLEQHDRHGLVLIGSPSGHGLSTTMYSIMARHDAYTASLKTLEREILLRVDGIDHVQWDPTNPDIDYQTNLQSILRRDPDVVMTSYVKDKETAEIVTAPGIKGPLIYIPQKASNIPEQIRMWVKIVGNVKKAIAALRVVINQRLLRTLCPNCRQAFKPTPDQLKKLNLPAGKVNELYRPGGKVQVKNKIEVCPVCGGTGHLGQTGVFEIMVVDNEMRKMFASGDLKAVMAHARRNKMIYLQEAALAKVVSGDTTIEEVIRVTAPAKPEAKKAKPEKASAD